jgi:GAF domain-containing protein/anti-sigma regulatory factor (Ser/Thr protein kinase)
VLAEVLLIGALDVVPRARRLVAETLTDLPTDVVDDVELIVTELVTNAVLHGEQPITLRLHEVAGGARVEVEDSSRSMPVVPRSSTDAMTGRGLALVATLADSWGVEPVAGDGKVVWAEVGPGTSREQVPPDFDLDALLASFDDDEEPTWTVRLGEVPTELLLSAKSHIDNVVREFALARGGGEDLPAPLSALIETVTRDFAEARGAIKRQAIAAADRGETTTDLVLRLHASAADAGDRYLTALDDADRYARAARLLTLETPPEHRVFRRWYVQALVDQLRAAASGAPPPPVPTLVDALAEEVRTLSGLREGWERLRLLQRVTGELTGASTVEEIATTVARNAGEHLGAVSARVYVLGDDGVLRSVATHGGTQGWVEAYSELPLSADLPGPEVVRTGQAMVLRDLAEIAERFPSLSAVYDTERSLHVAPLRVADHRLGVLSLAFPPEAGLGEQAREEFVTALADALAQALERARALTRVAEANERLTFLSDAAVALTASLEYRETVEAVAHLLVPRLADWCVVQVVEHGDLRTVRTLHVDPDKTLWAERMSLLYPPDPDAATGAPNVLRTGRTEVYPEVPRELVRQAAVDEEHLRLIDELALGSVMVVPLTGRIGTFGAITLIYAESGRHYTQQDVPFVEDVARRAAMAIETARTFREQSGRLADVTRVAEAAQHAILAPPPARVGPVALAARYVSAAAEALVGGDLYEVVARPGAVRLLIGDVRGKGLTAVRTATVVLGEFRAAAADLDDVGAVVRQIDRRLRPYLGDEDFVTALLAEVRDDGTYRVASCGHPPAVLASGGTVAALDCAPTLPLGLGAEPQVLTGRLAAGDRLLLYTDGLVEARDTDHRFVDLVSLVRRLSDGDLDPVLDRLLHDLRAFVGGDLGDDLALVLAEYCPG